MASFIAKILKKDVSELKSYLQELGLKWESYKDEKGDDIKIYTE
jgi:hypothetical protein